MHRVPYRGGRLAVSREKGFPVTRNEDPAVKDHSHVHVRKAPHASEIRKIARSYGAFPRETVVSGRVKCRHGNGPHGGNPDLHGAADAVVHVPGFRQIERCSVIAGQTRVGGREFVHQGGKGGEVALGRALSKKKVKAPRQLLRSLFT